MALNTSIECVLFDLDGTLIDTAPDFEQVVNTLLQEQGRPPIDPNLIGQTVSNGARALVTLAFTIEQDHADFDRLHQRLLALYLEQIRQTRATLYPGMEQLLDNLEAANIPWGIVTNKPEKYSQLLLENMALLHRCKSLVCPDHVQETKPHPEPILLACQQLDVDTERTVYLGDHLRDIQAAKNADVIAIAAAYGYLAADARVEEWYADFILQAPEQAESLLNLLRFA